MSFLFSSFFRNMVKTEIQKNLCEHTNKEGKRLSDKIKQNQFSKRIVNIIKNCKLVFSYQLNSLHFDIILIISQSLRI